jgi:hypothetical protein
MFQLKHLTKEAIPAALEKAQRYRLLNEPGEAESICLDILGTDHDNQEALVILLLALTDRFGRGYSVGTIDPRDVLTRLHDPYERAYYGGIIHERKAKARLHGGFNHDAYEHLREAMTSYEQAESLSPPGNPDAALRWNACARMITSNRLEPRTTEERNGVETD